MYAANFLRENRYTCERHKYFYMTFLRNTPQPALRRKLKEAPHGPYPLKGAIYSVDLETYIAPAVDRDFWPQNTPMRSLRMFDCWYSFIDTMPETGATRLNVTMHGFDLDEGESFLRTVHPWSDKDKPGIGPEEYAARVRKLMVGEDIDHLQMLTCYSANGGENAFAALVAEDMGMPVTGYRGEMLAVTGPSLRAALAAGRPKNRTIGIGPLNTRMYFPKKEKWLPTAVGKEFRPSFGARGFDDMASFFEGAFLL